MGSYTHLIGSQMFASEMAIEGDDAFPIKRPSLILGAFRAVSGDLPFCDK